MKWSMIEQQPHISLAAEQARAIYSNAPISNLAILCASLLFFFLLRQHLQPDLLLAWTAIMWCTAGYRLSLWYRRHQQSSAASPETWLRRYAIASLLVGIAWSLVCLFLADMSNPIVVASLFMLIFGVNSSAVAILSVHTPTFAGYVYPQILVMTGIFISHSTPEIRLLVIVWCLYPAVLTLFARNANALFIAQTRLVRENQALVDQLNAENARREAIIQSRTSALSRANSALEQEIAERKKVEEALRQQQHSLQHLAHHDPLTGLPNRLLMIDRLEHSLRKAHRMRTGLAVLFIDLDHFKEINDSLGHTQGDRLLVAVAKRLRERLREEDTVARLGGDEFVILIEHLRSSMDASALAETIQDAFSEPMDLGDRELSITASIGISLYPDDGTDTETLLRTADAAMYRAKSEGRNGFRFYSQ